MVQLRDLRNLCMFNPSSPWRKEKSAGPGSRESRVSPIAIDSPTTPRTPASRRWRAAGAADEPSMRQACSRARIARPGGPGGGRGDLGDIVAFRRRRSTIVRISRLRLRPATSSRSSAPRRAGTSSSDWCAGRACPRPEARWFPSLKSRCRAGRPASRSPHSASRLGTSPRRNRAHTPIAHRASRCRDTRPPRRRQAPEHSCSHLQWRRRRTRSNHPRG